MKKDIQYPRWLVWLFGVMIFVALGSFVTFIVGVIIKHPEIKTSAGIMLGISIVVVSYMIGCAERKKLK